MTNLIVLAALKLVYVCAGFLLCYFGKGLIEKKISSAFKTEGIQLTEKVKVSLFIRIVA